MNDNKNLGRQKDGAEHMAGIRGTSDTSSQEKKPRVVSVEWVEDFALRHEIAEDREQKLVQHLYVEELVLVDSRREGPRVEEVAGYEDGSKQGVELAEEAAVRGLVLVDGRQVGS